MLVVISLNFFRGKQKQWNLSSWRQNWIRGQKWKQKIKKGRTRETDRLLKVHSNQQVLQSR